MATVGEFTCRDLVEVITDYLERSLSPQERALFEQHLAICRGCHNYLDQMKKAISISGELTVESVPEESRERLIDAFRDWNRGRREAPSADDEYPSSGRRDGPG